MVPEKKRVEEVLRLLDEEYGTDVACYLHHQDAWQLLVATILSAQCTDDRVNMVTKELFVKYPDIRSFAKSDLAELENDIRSIGFYRAKAKNIKACAIKLLESFSGRVPEGIDELVALPGVGRKTANVIRGNIYDEPSIVVDTHVKRVSGRLGFTKNTEPEKIEYDLMKVLPREHWIRYNIQIIALGRTICKARKAECEKCFLQSVCEKNI